MDAAEKSLNQYNKICVDSFTFVRGQESYTYLRITFLYPPL